MICTTCQRKAACLPLSIAQHDQQLQEKLNQLKQCDMYTFEQNTRGGTQAIAAMFQTMRNSFVRAS